MWRGWNRNVSSCQTHILLPCFYSTCMVLQSCDAHAPRTAAPTNTASIWSGNTTGNPERNDGRKGFWCIVVVLANLEVYLKLVYLHNIQTVIVCIWYLLRWRESARTGRFCSALHTGTESWCHVLLLSWPPEYGEYRAETRERHTAGILLQGNKGKRMRFRGSHLKSRQLQTHSEGLNGGQIEHS